MKSPDPIYPVGFLSNVTRKYTGLAFVYSLMPVNPAEVDLWILTNVVGASVPVENSPTT